MLIPVCLLLLSVGVHASYADGATETTTEDELFSQLEVFPENFLSRFPGESQFFTTKILVYLFFNMFAKYLGEHEPIKFWTKFNHDDFNRVAIDAAFYEYLTKFVDGKIKHQVFDPLESSASTPEDIAIHRIGDYLDNLSAAEVPAGQSETQSQAIKMEDYMHLSTKCAEITIPTPILGIPGKDYPNYCEIPKTAFTCADKLVPGIYADLETGCQVFHICLHHRIDSYLCPIGTTFNQTFLTCDFWHESDCSSSPLLFDYPSLFANGKIPGNTEPNIAMGETKTTSESSSTFTPESDIPDYDETCQDLINMLLQPYMKFVPAKCKVANLKPSTSNPIEQSNKNDAKHFDRLMADLMSGNFGEMFELLIKMAELQSRMQGAAQWPELRKKWLTPKLDSKVLKAATESTFNDYVDTTTEEQIYTSTTELPFDNQDISTPQVNSRLEEKPVFQETSQGKVKPGRSVTKSSLLKPSKPSEDTIKQVFHTMIKTLEMGGKILNDGILPLIEKIVLDSRRKKAKYNFDIGY